MAQNTVRRDDRTEIKLKGWKKIASLLREDTSGFHPRLIALNFLVGLLPRQGAPLTRARLLSLVGFRIGEGTRFAEPPRFNGDPYFDIAPVPTSGDMQLRWGPTGTVDAVWSDWSPSQTVLP